jgi:hypothetical protein
LQWQANINCQYSKGLFFHRFNSFDRNMDVLEQFKRPPRASFVYFQDQAARGALDLLPVEQIFDGHFDGEFAFWAGKTGHLLDLLHLKSSIICIPT